MGPENRDMASKRLRSFLIVLAAVANLHAGSIAEGVCGDNVSWQISTDAVLTISGTGAMDDYSARIDVPWYADYSKSIRKIVVEEGVSHIGKYAFADCVAKEVDLSEGLSSIGNYAFRYCHNIQSITFPASLESVGKFAFDQTNLETVVVTGSTPPALGTKAFVTANDINTDVAGTSTTVNDLDYPYFSVPCGNVEDYKQVWPTYAAGVYCADDFAREYDGEGNSRYILFAENRYTPKGNSLLVTSRTDILGDNVVVDDGEKLSCASLSLTDTAAFVAPFSFAPEVFNFNRSGKLGTLISLYLPVEMPTDYVNGNVYVFNDFDGDFLNFTTYEGSYLQANYPYVVTPDAEEDILVRKDARNCRVETAESTTVTKGHMNFFGVNRFSSYVSDAKNTYIVFNGGKIKKYDKINLNAFRAAFLLTEATYATLGFKIDGELTGVALVEDGLVSDVPVNVYDAAGRLVRGKVAPAFCLRGLPAGVYIVNGQKYSITKSEDTVKPAKRQLKAFTPERQPGVGE